MDRCRPQRGGVGHKVTHRKQGFIHFSEISMRVEDAAEWCTGLDGHFEQCGTFAVL